VRATSSSCTTAATSRPSADRSRTLAATAETLQKYAAAGFEFVTVPELVRPD